MAPATNEIANPWKIGSNKMIEAPITTAPVVNKIGVVLTAPASIIACLIGIPSFNRISIKSINKTEFRTITPANAIIPINEVAVKARLPGQQGDKYRNAVKQLANLSDPANVSQVLASNNIAFKNGKIMGGRKTRKIRKQKGGFTYKSTSVRKRITSTATRSSRRSSR